MQNSFGVFRTESHMQEGIRKLADLREHACAVAAVVEAVAVRLVGGAQLPRVGRERHGRQSEAVQHPVREEVVRDLARQGITEEAYLKAANADAYGAELPPNLSGPQVVRGAVLSARSSRTTAATRSLRLRDSIRRTGVSGTAR